MPGTIALWVAGTGTIGIMRVWEGALVAGWPHDVRRKVGDLEAAQRPTEGWTPWHHVGDAAGIRKLAFLTLDSLTEVRLLSQHGAGRLAAGGASEGARQ